MRRMILLAMAFVCLTAAVGIIARAGLPDRATTSPFAITMDSTISAPEAGARAPLFSVMSDKGVTTPLEDARGSIVVINFWATWCIPCQLETPELQALSTSNDRVQVIGVNLGESADTVSAWRDVYGVHYSLILDTDGRIAAAYALRGQPTTFVIAPDGTIAHIFTGAVTQAALQSVVDALTSS